MPSRDPGGDDLPEDHLHQACQEDRVCPAAPKNKQKINSWNGQSLQSFGGQGFSDTFLAFPSCQRLQRGESAGKAAVTCWESAYFCGQSCSSILGCCSVSAGTSHVQTRYSNESSTGDAGTRGIKLLSCRKGTMLQEDISSSSTSGRLSDWGGSLVQEMPILWGQMARRLTGKGRAELPQSTALAALTPFNDYLFN